MSYLDIILLVVLAGFTLFGFWSGFLQSVGSIIGTIAGVILANEYFVSVSGWVVAQTGWGENTARVVTFLLLFIVMSRLIGLVFWLAEKILRLVPFGRTVNRISGAALGFVEGVLAIGVFMYLVDKFPLTGTFASTISSSFVVDLLQPVIVRVLDKLPWLFSQVMGLL